MKRYICSITITVDAYGEEDALDEVMNYLTEMRRSEVEVREDTPEGGNQ